MKFTFNRGNWGDGNSLPDWVDGEDFDDYLKKIGYSTIKTTYGNEHGGEIEIYESLDGLSFYASVCPSGGNVYEVFLPDFPSYMIFIRDHAVAFSSESSNFHQKEILGLLEKFFQLHHGHSSYDVCSQCDPVAWERNAKTRNEKQKSY